MAPPTIIVIGASTGGIDAVRVLVAAFPCDLNAAVFVVLHVGAHKSALPALLSQWGKLPACHPVQGETVRRGHIYVAPPDRHMVLRDGSITLTRGPRENWARPAIDPLFRSAAIAYGPRVVGVILTGGLNDGTAGLFEICQHGGTTIVQDPDEAADSGMPRSALRHVAVDHCLRLDAIATLLVTLAAKPPEHAPGADGPNHSLSFRSEEMTTGYTLDDPVAVTCPDCGGALRKSEIGTLTQYRCHIGHVYTAEVMVAAQFTAMEWSLEAAMRALSERGAICRQMAEASRKGGDYVAAANWDAAMEEAKSKTGALRAVLQHEWLQPGG